MLTHRLYARPFALSRAQRRCLWCGGSAGGGPGIDLDEPLGRTSWRACGEEHALLLARTLGWARDRSLRLRLGILGSLLALLGLSAAAALGWPAGLAAADAVAVFRLGVALTVLPFGWLGPLARPPGQAERPAALPGPPPGARSAPSGSSGSSASWARGGSWPPCCTSRGGSLDRPRARALALPVLHGHPRAPLMRRDSPAVVPRRPPLLPERRRGPRLPGRLAAPARPPQRGRALLHRHDRGRVHGRARHRQPPRRAPLRAARRAGALGAFAALELGISAFGAASTWLYYDWLYPWAVHLPSPSWQAGLLHLVALLPPTTLMGMSLPYLVRAVVTDVEGAGRRIGWLYGVNMLGAAAGALATPWLLLPALGVRGAVVAAAGANLAVGLGALGLFGLRKGSPAAPAAPAEAPVPPPGAERPGNRPLGLWLSLYALSGFVALSLEIVWFRLLDVAVKSTAFTFGTVLAVYLLGSAVGALAGAPLVVRVRRPLRAFLLAQCGILALAVLPRARRGGAPAGCAGLLLVRRVLGGLRLLPARPRPGPVHHPAPLRAAAARAFLPPHGAHGGVVPGPAARGPRRSRDERPQGRGAAGREHRGVRRRQPAGRPRAPAAPRDAGHAAPPRPRRGPVRRWSGRGTTGGSSRSRRSPSFSWRLPCPGRSGCGGGCTGSRPAPRSPSSTRTRRASWP